VREYLDILNANNPMTVNVITDLQGAPPTTRRPTITDVI
jgi:hypothetical protein